MKNIRNLLKEIHEALAKDPSFKNCLESIHVIVNDGAVILSGSVTNTQLKKLAKKIVSAVAGVSLLIEDLKIEHAQPSRVGVQIDWAGGRMVLTH